MCTRQGRYRVAVSYSHDGKGVVGGLALGGRMAERHRDAKRGGGWEWVRAGDWGWMRKGGRTLGVSRGSGGGGGGGGGSGGGGPTEGGEDRDTKGFDVQPFHRLRGVVTLYHLLMTIHDSVTRTYDMTGQVKQRKSVEEVDGYSRWLAQAKGTGGDERGLKVRRLGGRILLVPEDSAEGGDVDLCGARAETRIEE
ncbi:Uncharacterized protein DBV15_00623 [Temnothorax longispinosus]|uniref:Uncharacterized protein n=1 Tax=Temnothorax longispinosus TaxID=300112 RepID=A0A4S2KT60_9HYME|nr:Uncharacterized protein DBV15_00623 [Temnothorax longispinosus]